MKSELKQLIILAKDSLCVLRLAFVFKLAMFVGQVYEPLSSYLCCILDV